MVSSVEQAARETKTAKGRGQRGASQSRTLVPAIVPDAVYWAADIKAAFQMSASAIGRMKREGVETFRLPRGDLVTGSSLIDWLRSKKRLSPEGRIAT